MYDGEEPVDIVEVDWDEDCGFEENVFLSGPTFYVVVAAVIGEALVEEGIKGKGSIGGGLVFWACGWWSGVSMRVGKIANCVDNVVIEPHAVQ